MFFYASADDALHSHKTLQNILILKKIWSSILKITKEHNLVFVPYFVKISSVVLMLQNRHDFYTENYKPV